MRRISLEFRDKIKKLALEGVSSRQIANQLNISHTTASNYTASYSIKGGRTGPGRPSKMPDRLKALLVRKTEAGKFENAEATARHVRSEHNINVSGQAIRNMLRSAGLKNYAKVKKPRLSPIQIKKRLIFARVHKHHTLDYWKNVMFTDESKFNLYGSDGNKRVWKRPGSVLQDHHVRKVVKFGGGSVMVWGGICYNGVGKLVFIVGKMDSIQYQSILGTGHNTSIEMHSIDQANLIFQQDNDPKHTSRSTKAWMEANGFNVLEWPSNSPDMNPIEHVWNDVDVRVRKNHPQARNIDELKNQIEEEWYKTSPEYINELFSSMPRRIKALADAKGRNTKY
jgi:transposase